MSSSVDSGCFRLFPITVVGIPPRGRAAEGDERSRVRTVSENAFWEVMNLCSGCEFSRGTFALVPRNVGATRFLPSFVIVTFCCNICGVATATISYMDRSGGRYLKE